MSEHESPQTEDAVPPPVLRVRIGIGLILLSGVFWFSLLAVPFVPITGTHKAALTAGLFIGVQIAWWTGAAIAGPMAVRRLLDAARRLLPRRNRDAAKTVESVEADEATSDTQPHGGELR